MGRAGLLACSVLGLLLVLFVLTLSTNLISFKLLLCPFSLSLFKIFVYLFERMRERGGGSEEKQGEKRRKGERIPSRLCAEHRASPRAQSHNTDLS